MLYLNFKNNVRKIIDKHFPNRLSERFRLRSDSEIYIPKEDEGVWTRQKKGTEAIHILFDNYEIFEIPQNLDKRYAEVYFLRAFKNAMEEGVIKIESVKEWSDKETAKKRKKEIKKEKKTAIKKLIKDTMGGGE